MSVTAQTSVGEQSNSHTVIATEQDGIAYDNVTPIKEHEDVKSHKVPQLLLTKSVWCVMRLQLFAKYWMTAL